MRSCRFPQQYQRCQGEVFCECKHHVHNNFKILVMDKANHSKGKTAYSARNNIVLMNVTPLLSKIMECRRRRTCAICKKRHPTPLHGDVRRTSNQTDQRNQDRSAQHSDAQEHRSTSSCARLDQLSTARSMIVPVWISHVSCTEEFKEKMIYALLDTQSDTTFTLESTKDKMGLRGVEVNLRLSTMSSRDERIQSERLEGLSVRSHDGEKKSTTHLY